LDQEPIKRSSKHLYQRDGASDDEARQACWRNVKLKYKKVGDKWVPKEEVTTMEMEQLTETLFSPLQLTEEDEQGYYHAKLLCTRGDFVNGNGRVYPMAIWEREIPRVKDLITKGRFIGLADHPSGGFFGAGASIVNTVIKFDDLRIEGREVWGDVTIIPTSKGKDVIEIAKAGVQIGASTRGRGSMNTPEDGYTDPDGVVHQNVGVVDTESYKFDAVDLVLQPSVDDAGMYRFEQLNDDDIEQLQDVLFAHIEERVSEPLQAKIMELEELLEAAGETIRVMEEDGEEAVQLMDNFTADLAKRQNTIVEQEQMVGELNERLGQLVEENHALDTENAALESTLTASNSRNAALLYLLERTKGEKFSALLVEELKGCLTCDEIDERFDAAMSTVNTLVAGSPTPSGKAIINPQRTDLDTDTGERIYDSLHGGEELTEEEKAQARRNKLIRAQAGLDMLE
jgi:hypothetical protein